MEDKRKKRERREGERKGGERGINFSGSRGTNTLFYPSCFLMYRRHKLPGISVSPIHSRPSWHRAQAERGKYFKVEFPKQ